MYSHTTRALTRVCRQVGFDKLPLLRTAVLEKKFAIELHQGFVVTLVTILLLVRKEVRVHIQVDGRPGSRHDGRWCAGEKVLVA